MSKIKKRLAALAVACLLIGACWMGYARMQHNSAVACVLEWGRLAPFPSTAKGFTITAEGSAFSRAFRVHFVASPEEIEQWISESPGLREVIPQKRSPRIRLFDVAPGGEAQQAEVEIDDRTHTVEIYVCWS